MTPDRPISSLFDAKRPLRSLEFFPPKNEEGVAALRETAVALKAIDWDFVSVTYGWAAALEKPPPKSPGY